MAWSAGAGRRGRPGGAGRRAGCACFTTLSATTANVLQNTRAQRHDARAAAQPSRKRSTPGARDGHQRLRPLALSALATPRRYGRAERAPLRQAARPGARGTASII
jgi:hypothetical protein